MEAVRQYLKDHNESDFEISDKVKIIRIPKDYELGWDYCTQHYINEFKNKTLKIFSNQNAKGFEVVYRDDDDCPHYLMIPYFCLELIEKSTPPIIIGDNKVKFQHDFIEVGCQNIGHDIVDKIYNKIHEKNNKD